MNKDEVTEYLVDLLVEQQGVSAHITADHRICRDLGVCGGDFQEFMTAAWGKYELPMIEPVSLGIAEDSITVGDVAEMIASRQSADGSADGSADA